MSSKYAKNSLACVIAAYSLLLACQREISVEVPKGSFAIVSDLHAKNRSEVLSFAVNAGSDISVSTPKGTKIRVPANGFVTLSGQPVTGNVQITVKEIYTPGEMILNNMPTMSGGRLLESGGEFEIRATQKGDQLKLAPGNFIRIEIPSAGRDLQGMQVFNGTPDPDGNVDWTLNSSPGNVVVRDSLLFSDANLFADDINWLNCDKFINDPTVDFTAYPGNAPGGDSTNVFVHLTGRNSVVKMNWTQGLNYFQSDKLLAVPSTIVGISAKDGRLFASITTITVTDGASITMNFLPYTEQSLKDRLSQLR